MDVLTKTINCVGLSFFALSILALRLTVISLVKGNRNTFSMFTNLYESVSKKERRGLFCKAITTTFGKFQGEKKLDDSHDVSEGLSFEKLISLKKSVRGYWQSDPKDGDSAIYAIRSIAWCALTMYLALLTFIVRTIHLVLVIVSK